jgi:hypothetical protein
MVIVEPLQTTVPTKGSVVTLKSPDSEQILELNYYEQDSPFKQKGIEVIVEPYAIGSQIGWKEAYVKDPNGIWIEFLERK